METNAKLFVRRILPLLAIAALSTACQPDSLLPAGEAAGISPEAAVPSIQAPQDCPVTEPPDPPFVPPLPWPPQPPSEDDFWFGGDGLWTALPKSGSWRQLAITEKFWWWSNQYGVEDVAEDWTPDLMLTAERLDGSAPSFQVSDATNGYHESFNQAMLIGVTLPSPGCWQFHAQFKGNELSFVLWVPPE